MDLSKQNILMFERTMDLGGSSKVVLQMCKILKPLVNKIIVCSTGGAYVKHLNSMNVTHYTIPDVSNLNLFNAIKIFFSLYRIIKREHITVVHTHHRMAAMYTGICSVLVNYYFIASVHNVFFDKKTFTRLAYKRANLIACGNVVKDNLIHEYSIDDQKITVISNAVEESSKMSEIQELKKYRDAGYTLVVYSGRLSEVKGVSHLIESLPLALKQYQKIIYVIVGEGYMKEKMVQIARKNKVLDNLCFLGYQEDPQNIMRQADIVVLPSLAAEGLPLTPMEAFAQGKPVVATPVGGTVEIVVDFNNGLLVEPKNPNSIADAIVTLCKDEKLYRQCCQNAKKTYKEHYSYAVFKSKLENYYNNLQI